MSSLTLHFIRPLLFSVIIFSFLGCIHIAQPPAKNQKTAVIAYYTGQPDPLDEATVSQLTHIIYSFLHLKGNKLALDNAQDSVSLAYLASLKKEHTQLKVMLSLGGWGGCETCSPVFATEKGRKEFAQSTKALLDQFGIDGIDLDWEYPAIEGYPGHLFAPEDKQHFTELVRVLRKTLGKKAIITFAAGGFEKYLEKSVAWDEVMPMVDFVNIMSYDLVNGNSTVTGHHTPLYSTEHQVESADHAVQYLDAVGVPLDKMVIGAAFYARVWENVIDTNQGLYQAGKFKQAVSYSMFEQFVRDHPGFVYHWDTVAQAPYWYTADQQLFATYDNDESVTKKTQYAVKHGLKGIMFWVLGEDKREDSLLKAISDTVKEEEGK